MKKDRIDLGIKWPWNSPNETFKRRKKLCFTAECALFRSIKYAHRGKISQVCDTSLSLKRQIGIVSNLNWRDVCCSSLNTSPTLQKCTIPNFPSSNHGISTRAKKNKTFVYPWKKLLHSETFRIWIKIDHWETFLKSILKCIQIWLKMGLLWNNNGPCTVGYFPWIWLIFQAILGSFTK